MRKHQRMSIKQFVNGIEEQSITEKIKHHISRNKTFYIHVAGATIIFLFCGFDGSASASSIDVGARKIYDKLLNIGKWVIVIKGGIDFIQTVTNGDLDGAKKKFLTYLLIFAALHALPWSMDEIEKMFKEM